jgi:uncharacterized membrane protein (Fun14 family)
MTLELNLPYDVMVGSIVGITILGIVYLITRAVIKVNQNKADSTCSCNEW